jgi:ABC-2 type transport system ATP-binding protein
VAHGRGALAALPPSRSRETSVFAVKPLTIRGLVRTYGETHAVDRLDLDVDPGQIVGLVGPNGSGKTTTLLVAVGLLEETYGEVLVNGHPAGSMPARCSSAFVPDDPSGLDELTVGELVELVGALYRGGPPYRERAARLLQAFGLEGRRGATLGSLSNGLRRQASVVVAAAVGTPLLVLDEATAALDPEAIIVLRELLRAVADKGAGVLVASQDLHFAETVCDSVYLLNRGRVVVEGEPGALKKRFGVVSLEGVFLEALGTQAAVSEIRASFRDL